VLYGDLDADSRALLHRNLSGYLRKLIEDGREENWSRLAEHLSRSGPECRIEAVGAWREAARRARARLAFDEAVVSFSKALRDFGEGPSRDPEDRYELLLEYAEAKFLAGDASGGHAECREALNIARSLEDAARMARAALTLGSAIVVARVDNELIDALRECLDALPESESAWRPRVLARLAAALQPAPDPSVPMDMARQALALARSTHDEDALYHVLRFAIGALMDFAPAGERRALNEEFAELASKRGDVPGRFRSTLRLIIDCCEIADRTGMDRYVDECRRIAERIGLPHYQWRACSVRAMQATIDGSFSRATRLLDLAEGYAGEIDDLEAKITIPLQRFAILIEWDSDDGWSFDKIEERLQSAYASGMSEAEFFVTPFVESHKQPLTRESARMALRNEAIVARTFAGGDRYSVCRLGETAAIAEDRDTAERAYRRNLQFEDHCATLGLMGSTCSGPISWTLAKLAHCLGRPDDADRFIDKAIAIAGSMRSPVWLARIHWTAAEILTTRGDLDGARRHDAAAREIAGRIGLRRDSSVAAPVTERPAADSDRPIELQQHGDMWHVDFRGAGTTLRDSKGLRMLDTLVSRPETDIHVLDLVGGSAIADEGAPGPALDDKARREYGARLRVLAEEIEDAEALGDIGRAEAARSEQDLLASQLSGAYGLGGRRRNTGSAAERARVNVRRRLKDAIDRIGQQLPEAGKYLESTVKTGTYCRYTPL
jgi:tetratricopeptide (TPR) repeat protein